MTQIITTTSTLKSKSEADSIIAMQREILAQRVILENNLKSKMLGSEQSMVTITSYRSKPSCVPKPLDSNMSGGVSSLSSGSIARPPPAKYRFTRGPHDKYKPCYAEDDTQSLSTATLTTCTVSQTPPLQLPSFKPAVGCISSDAFLIRCFVTRLRNGITVTKHSRSRFQRKSKAYVLRLEGEETLTWHLVTGGDGVSAGSSRSVTKQLDLSDCQEVRLASTPDPTNPGYTGTSTLREKCHIADAHKSFALIFPQRTLDITSVTADQCKMLTEGFSALCYQLHVMKNGRRVETKEREPNKRESENERGCFPC